MNDRSQRSVPQVQNYRRFHLSGDLSKTLQGRVASTVAIIQSPDKQTRSVTDHTNMSAFTPDKVNIMRVPHGNQSTASQVNTVKGPSATCTEGTRTTMAEELKAQLLTQQEANKKLEEQIEQMKLEHTLEQEKMKQRELEQAREELAAQQKLSQEAHEKRMEEQNNPPKKPSDDTITVDWLKQKLAELQEEKSVEQKEREEKVAQIQHLAEQQKMLAQEAATLAEDLKPGDLDDDLVQLLSDHKPAGSNTLVQQLRLALAPQDKADDTSLQRDIIKQFLVSSNKMQAPGGVSTLKPELLKQLTGESDGFSMADWLGKFNKQEQGECDLDPIERASRGVKSGILDKATANIMKKETWPQKNLLEDWADENIEFKNLQFEHHVAGEVRTIELCTEPAQILGRLKLLRRMAYAKLRGYDWPMVRKMYAAIVMSIKANEYTWESNFDHFEAILYRRPPSHSNHGRQGKSDDRPPPKKWFCRDWNKGECTRSAPHKATFGAGANAVSRTVHHICATCYGKDRSARDHPEGDDSCPHNI